MKKKRLNEEKETLTPKIMINSKTLKKNDERIEKTKNKDFKNLYDKYEKMSERKLLNPPRENWENAEINSRDGSERVIVGEVRTRAINTGSHTFRDDKKVLM